MLLAGHQLDGELRVAGGAQRRDSLLDLGLAGGFLVLAGQGPGALSIDAKRSA